MNIAIDVDDTLINEFDVAYAFGQMYGLEKNNSLDVKNINALCVSDIFGWDSNLEADFFKEKFIDVLYNTSPMPLAREVISRLKNEGNNIYIITARNDTWFPECYNKTKGWLEKFNIPYDQLHVDAKDKGEKCKELNIDAFIDDIEINCLSAYEKGIKCYLYHTICNKNFSHEDIVRVYSWVDVYYKLTGKNFEI